MKIQTLGNSGFQVSELCLGTMTFGNQPDKATAHAILDRAFGAGVFFIDTADVIPSAVRTRHSGAQSPSSAMASRETRTSGPRYQMFWCHSSKCE